MRLTVNQTASKLGVERDTAYNLIKFLEAVGLAKKTGEVVRVEGAKGKGADIYEIDAVVGTGRLDLLTKLKD